MYYKILSGLFSMNCSYGAWLRFVAGVRKGEGGANEQITIYFSQIHV